MVLDCFDSTEGKIRALQKQVKTLAEDMLGESKVSRASRWTAWAACLRSDGPIAGGGASITSRQQPRRQFGLERLDR